jgi:type I restriction enzyme, S subunit
VIKKSELPEGWEKATIGEVCEILAGYGFPKDLQGKASGDLPFYKVGDISQAWLSGNRYLVKANNYLSQEEAKKIKAKTLPAGTTVMAKIGEAIKLNRRALLAKPSLVDNNVMGIYPKPDYVDPRYNFYYLLTIRLGDYSQATTVPSVRKSDVSEILFPLAPLDQQKLIVAEIEKQFSRLDEAVEALKRIQANLKRYKASVLKAAVEGKLTEQWRKGHPDFEPARQLLKRILAERKKKWEEDYVKKYVGAHGHAPKDESWKKKYKEPAAPDTSDLPELPEGWLWSNLGHLTWSVKDGPHYSPKYSEAGIPFISGGNVRPEGIDFSTAKYISPELHAELSLRCKPEFGDLLYTKGGTTGIARINTENKEFNVWVHVAVLKLVDSIEQIYIQHALNSIHCYRQSQKYTHGVGNQDLGLTRMVWITIPIPPLQEQRAIICEIDRRLSIIHEMEHEIETNLKRAERLRQSILKKAFRGQLFVDSNYGN